MLGLILTSSWLQTFHSLVYTRIWKGVNKQCMLNWSILQQSGSRVSIATGYIRITDAKWTEGFCTMGYSILPIPSLARWIWSCCQQMPLPETLACQKADYLQHSVSTQHVHKEARFPNSRVCPTGEAASLRLPGSYTISIPASYFPARTWSPDSLRLMAWLFLNMPSILHNALLDI